ncbi:hypothetical protein [Dysgonomonas sp. HGC4]|uniref:hypothetical protein n=1 Tax=Dysgonomonas sp. HGC4 TaxID=1658009 RepID=UPI000682D6F2|nr:hypothetical protein [Dysgonomonas sp. HGC4]MBD8348562.1 hypothetical protein [Dysgonomonas sp. HGC4]
MAADRFKQYQYALVRFFRSRGYDINSIKKTIKIDKYDLPVKEAQRLKQLENYGFQVIDPKPEYSFNPTINYECEETFIDFADEIIYLCNNGL